MKIYNNIVFKIVGFDHYHLYVIGQPTQYLSCTRSQASYILKVIRGKA